ncbi:MAG: fumarate hydratase, partial [Anaerolineae bacterium UTCFX3]
MREITIPISDETIRSLKVGEPVLLTGVMVTGRDAA